MRCSHYTTSTQTERTESGRLVATEEHDRCPDEATRWLIAPDARRVPGCYFCERHASAIIAEYNAKLNENWTAQAIDWIGNPL